LSPSLLSCRTPMGASASAERRCYQHMFWAPGVLHDVPQELLWNWTEFFSEPYESNTSTGDLSRAPGKKLLIGARRKGTGRLLLCAMADKAQILKPFELPAGQDLIELPDSCRHNGVYWYFLPGHFMWPSFGFSRKPQIHLCFGDVHEYQDTDRLCWMLNGEGGQRAGDVLGNWGDLEKVMFYAQEDSASG